MGKICPCLATLQGRKKLFKATQLELSCFSELLDLQALPASAWWKEQNLGISKTSLRSLKRLSLALHTENIGVSYKKTQSLKDLRRKVVSGDAGVWGWKSCLQGIL